MSRELTSDVEEFNAEELSLMATNGVTGNEVREFIRTSSPQTIEVAIGGIQMLRKQGSRSKTE